MKDCEKDMEIEREEFNKNISVKKKIVKREIEEDEVKIWWVANKREQPGGKISIITKYEMCKKNNKNSNIRKNRIKDEEGCRKEKEE